MALTVRPFDANGQRRGECRTATWTLESLKGTVADGKFTADAAAAPRPASVKATVGHAQRRPRGSASSPTCRGPSTSRTAARRRRRSGSTPPASSRSATSTAARSSSSSRENPFAFAKRTRPFFGPPELSNYTIEADVRSMENRRQMGDVGIVAQRYELVLFGNHQRLELQPWQPEVQRTVKRRLHVEAGHLVHHEARGAGARRRARSGRAARCGRRASPSRPHGRSSGSIRSAARRAARASTPTRRIAAAGRLGDLLRQHQGLPEQEMNFMIKKTSLVATGPRGRWFHRGQSAFSRSRSRTGRCGAARPTATWSRP